MNSRLPKENDVYVMPGTDEHLTIVGLARVDYSTLQTVVYRNTKGELLCLPLTDFMWLLPTVVTLTPLQLAYYNGIEKFYSELTSLEPLRQSLVKAKRLSLVADVSLNSRVLIASMLNQYTVKFFGVSKTQIVSGSRHKALHGLVRHGIIELRTPGNSTLWPGDEILPGTKILLKKGTN